MTAADLSDPQSAFSGTRPVDPRYALDEAALDQWLTVKVEGYAGPLTVRQFKGGQSNPTYELATPGRASAQGWPACRPWKRRPARR